MNDWTEIDVVCVVGESGHIQLDILTALDADTVIFRANTRFTINGLSLGLPFSFLSNIFSKNILFQI